MPPQGGHTPGLTTREISSLGDTFLFVWHFICLTEEAGLVPVETRLGFFTLVHLQLLFLWTYFLVLTGQYM